MKLGVFRFGSFSLDPSDRQLRRVDVPVNVNARYLDALILLVRENGKLVSKDRLLDEVWRGAPVTDEALTQCIKTLRRHLGDSAGDPRFIETVPKHGYRFIAPVDLVSREDYHRVRTDAASDVPTVGPWQSLLRLGSAGTIGGGTAGIFGGLFYGIGAASHPLPAGVGSFSVLIVVVCLTILMALIAGAGVGFGIATAQLASGWSGKWKIIGGACGGLAVGAFVKLLGLDAFHLLFGRSPGDITGAAEGALLGSAVGLGSWLGDRGSGPSSLRRGVAAAGLAGGVAGLVIAMLGGRLMGGSLELLARHFPDSRLRLDQIGAIAGENEFGPVSQVITSGLEGALFGCVVGAMIVAQRGTFRRKSGQSTAG